MRWRGILTSPPPTTGWSLDGAMLAAVKRDSKGVLHCVAEALPEGACEVGPVGLQAVDGRRFAALLTSMQGRLDGARRAAVVLPAGWMRCHLLSFEELPRRQAELDQVVQWRLKKLLPVLPSELRVSALALPAGHDGRHVLCTVGVERALAELERSFADAGIQPGLITPRPFPLAGADGGGHRLVVQLEEGYLSLLLVEGGRPRMTRSKLLVGGDGDLEVVFGELHLSLQFIRTQLGVDGLLRVLVSAATDAHRVELREWWSRQADVELMPDPLPLPFAEPRVAEAVGMARLAPVLALIDGVHP
jgi:hypothetical protein